MTFGGDTESIIKKIEEAGFTVSMTKEAHLTKEQAEQLYSEHKDKDFFDNLTQFMSRYIHMHTYVCLCLYVYQIDNPGTDVIMDGMQHLGLCTGV